MAEQSKKKVAVVTGASRGIGRAIALELASRGAAVVINYNGSEERAREVQKEIEEKGGEAEIRQWNVADYKACESAVKDIVKTHGSIDILVNNAGITKDGLLMGMSEEDFDQVIDVNLKGTFNMMRFAPSAQWTHHQHGICSWNCRKCRTGKLCSVQSRNHWYDQKCSKGTCIPRCYGQCSCTGIY